MSDVGDLERQLDAAYAAIQELDEDLAAGRLSPDDHAELKRRSERHAAALLTRLREAAPERRADPPEQRAAAPGEAHASRARPSRQREGGTTVTGRSRSPLAPGSVSRRLGMGALILVVFGVVLGALLARFTSDERPPASAAAPGAMPGAPAATPGAPGAAAAPAISPALDALRKEVEREDAPTKKLLAFAHLALDEGQIPASIWAYKRVLAGDPRNVEAITHIAVILAQGNHVDDALRRLDEAIRLDPKYAHAHWDRAQILFNGKKDYVAAVGALEAFLDLMPAGEDAGRAQTMLAEARKLAALGVQGGPPAPAGASGAGAPVVRRDASPLPAKAAPAATTMTPAKEATSPGR